jgi:hypothetical protein
MYQVEGRVEFETEKAFLLEPTIGPKQVWVPKSQISARTEKDGDGNVLFDVSDWWYEQCYMKELEK